MNIENNLLYISLQKYYSEKNKLNILLKYLRYEKISLRIIDWFVTNYSKKHDTIYLIDDKQLYVKLSITWKNNLGYIPQSSFLANDTIINNVALGVNEKDIEINKIKEIADITQISTFIENNLPNKYQTLVGERGIRLSGGQRQLLTIARALYSEPDVLIMDEATSSLDGITEEKLIHSIRKNFRFKTIIMIAHRLSTLKECDNIFLMDKVKVVDSGSYDYLIKNNLIFKQMSGENRTKFDDL